MINWKVFKRDDPRTYPEVDCPMLVCWRNGDEYRLYNTTRNNERNGFQNEDFRLICFRKGDIFYSYICYLPYIERECHPMWCNKEDWLCEYCDNGYCLCEKKCKHQCDRTEYSLGSTKIWKEFEEL